jgi:hypothetical protein
MLILNQHLEHPLTENIVFTEQVENFKISPLPYQSVKKLLVTTLVDSYRVGPLCYDRLKRSYTLRLCEHQFLGNCHVLVQPAKLVSNVCKNKENRKEVGWKLFKDYVYQQRGQLPDGILPAPASQENNEQKAEQSKSQPPVVASKDIAHWVEGIPRGANSRGFIQQPNNEKTSGKWMIA